jgi:hypothetical protein
VATLAVHEDQSLVRAEAAQRSPAEARPSRRRSTAAGS